MHPKTEQFLILFNDFEEALKEKQNKIRYEPFSLMVREEGKRNHLIRNNKAFLLDAADLRNVLVHTEDEMIMAVPSDEMLDKLKGIYDKYVKVLTAMDLCKSHPLILKPEYSLRKVLLLMKQHEIFQFPVYDGKHCLGIVTANTVTRWMADYMDDDGVLSQDLDNTTAAMMLTYSEEKDRAVFVARNKDINELLMEISGYKKPAGAFIVTEHGRNDESPLGVFTNGALAHIK